MSDLSNLRRIFFVIFLFGIGGRNVGAVEYQCTDDSDFSSNALKLVLKWYRSNIISEGLPELNFPPLEPLKINRINFETKNKQIGDLNLDLTNLTLTKLATFEIKSACMFFFSRRIIVNITVPVIYASGNYNLSGVMENLSPGKRIDLTGSGQIDFSLHNLEIYAHLVIGLGNSAYLRHFDFDYSVGGVNLNLENLMGTKKHVSLIMNQVINELFPEALRQLKPEILPSSHTFLKEKIDNIISYLTFQKMFTFMLKIAADS